LHKKQSALAFDATHADHVSFIQHIKIKPAFLYNYNSKNFLFL